MKKTCLFVSLLLSIFLISALSPARAQRNDPFARGRDLFDAGRYQEAYDLFFQAFKNDPADLTISFYLGRAAFESGDYEAAVMAYDRILISQPDSPRVKLELARSYLRLGAREMARQYFKEVLATKPPEAVWKNIERFLAEIERGEKHHFLNGLFSVAYNWDDNVNVAPTDNVILFGLFPVSLDQGPRSDHLYTTTTVINHLYRFEDRPFAWKTSFTNYNAIYENQNIFDINYYGITSGPVYQSEKYLCDLNLNASQVNLSYDRYLGAFGLTASLTRVLTPDILFNFSLALAEKNYYQDGDRDAFNTVLSGGPVFNFGLNRISVTLGREFENAASDQNSYHRLLLFLRYDRMLPHGYGLFSSLRLQKTEYGAPDPLFLTKRSDHVYDLTVGASRELWRSEDQRRSLALQLSHTYTESHSNVGLYAYDKKVTAASLSLAF